MSVKCKSWPLVDLAQGSEGTTKKRRPDQLTGWRLRAGGRPVKLTLPGRASVPQRPQSAGALGTPDESRLAALADK
jgi:hypothetical protein